MSTATQSHLSEPCVALVFAPGRKYRGGLEVHLDERSPLNDIRLHMGRQLLIQVDYIVAEMAQ